MTKQFSSGLEYRAVAEDMLSLCGIGSCTDENIIDIHIPANGGSVYPHVCDEAIKLADEFFVKFFPEHPYQYYTCF